MHRSVLSEYIAHAIHTEDLLIKTTRQERVALRSLAHPNAE